MSGGSFSRTVAGNQAYFAMQVFFVLGHHSTLLPTYEEHCVVTAKDTKKPLAQFSDMALSHTFTLGCFINKTGPSLKSWVAQLYPTPSSPTGMVRLITQPPPPPPHLYPLIFPASLSPFSWVIFTSLHLAFRIDDLEVLSHIPFLTTWTKRKSE